MMSTPSPHRKAEIDLEQDERLTPHKNPLYTPAVSRDRVSTADGDSMPSSDILASLGLSRNPFTDRTAEKARLDASALYVHSDLQGFAPNETTYVFFGRRGVGKTTIRLQMQTAYADYNDKAKRDGGLGHLVVDLARPGNVSSCLATFKDAIGAAEDTWDASFAEHWSEADIVDCILCHATTELVGRLTNPEDPLLSQRLTGRLKADPRAARHMLLLAHLYAITDASTLATLRRDLTPPIDPVPIIKRTAVIGGAAAAAIGASRVPQVQEAASGPIKRLQEEMERSMPWLFTHPRLCIAAALGASAGATYLTMRSRAQWSLSRASQLQGSIRVVRHIDTGILAALLDRLFTRQDSAGDIRNLYIGVSTSQKMELLKEIVHCVGYESVAVFGDCFDECPLLDPVQHPTALKVFAARICRNDLLSVGRQHWFFPDSRLGLDLNTDRTLKEARFDRHFVRDLTWSRHQLEQLAQRRFEAARMQSQYLNCRGSHLGRLQEGFKSSRFTATHNFAQGKTGVTFEELFQMVDVEDFSSYLSKINTPRELLIMMTYIISRLESNPAGNLTAQDMEIAVDKAKEQNV